jgi:hypothetical protein
MIPEENHPGEGREADVMETSHTHRHNDIHETHRLTEIWNTKL